MTIWTYRWFLSAALWASATVAAAIIVSLVAAEPAVKPRFPVGRETTYLDGPLTPDGYVDYIAAQNAHYGRGVTPENNAAVLLWEAFGPKGVEEKKRAEFFQLLGMAPPPSEGAYVVSFSEYLRQVPELSPDDADELWKDTPTAEHRPWSADEFPHIAGWLAANQTQLNLIVTATKRPKYFQPIVVHAEPGKWKWLAASGHQGIALPRDATRLLVTRAMQRTAAGRYDEAWDDLLACHRLARLVSHGPSTIDSLVAASVEGMTQYAETAFLVRAAYSSKQYLARLDDLRRLPPFASFVERVDRSERFNHLDNLQGTSSGDPMLLAVMVQGLAGVFQGLKEPDAKAIDELRRADFEPMLRDGNRRYDHLAAVLKIRDFAERKREWDRLSAEIKALEPKDKDAKSERRLAVALKAGHVDPQLIADYLLTQFFFGSQLPDKSCERIEQMAENFQVAFALAAYRTDHGRYPEKLDDLRRQYLPVVPEDRFSGGPLKYRRTDDGYLLYSIGPDLRDDGGLSYQDGKFNAHDDATIRLPPTPPKPLDVGF